MIQREDRSELDRIVVGNRDALKREAIRKDRQPGKTSGDVELVEFDRPLGDVHQLLVGIAVFRIVADRRIAGVRSQHRADHQLKLLDMDAERTGNQIKLGIQPNPTGLGGGSRGGNTGIARKQAGAAGHDFNRRIARLAATNTAGEPVDDDVGNPHPRRIHFQNRPKGELLINGQGGLINGHVIRIYHHGQIAGGGEEPAQ